MKTRKIALSLAVVIVAVTGVAVFTKLGVRSAPPYDQNFAAAIQSGVASEAPCPSTTGGVSQAVDNATSFIAYRSGATLTGTIKQRLVQLEQSSISSSTGLSMQQAKDVIAAAFMERVSSVTDDEIDEMARYSLRVTPCAVYEGRIDEVQLRASKGNLDWRAFKEKASEFRDGSTEEALALQVAVPELIGEEVLEKAKGLAYASASQWDVSYYSPYRVFLLAYAVMTDDPLAYSHTQVTSQMQSTSNWLYSNKGLNCPYASASPFGKYGFIYRTPMDVFFSVDVQHDLLDRIDAIL